MSEVPLEINRYTFLSKHNLIQIVGRIVCLTLFAYIFGAGNFWPLMVFIAFHVLLITGIQTMFDKLVWNELSFKNFFDNLLNGIANIYFPNKINQYATGKSERHVKGLNFGQLLFMEMIIMIENCVMLISVLVRFWNNTLVIGLIIGSFSCYLLGLAFKMAYYNFFYIWKHVVWTDLYQLKSEIKAIRAKQQLTQKAQKSDPQTLLVEETKC